MISKFDNVLGILHDARFYGFLLDSNPKTFNLNVLLYIHIFSNFESGKYSLEKGLVTFENSVINRFTITDDLSSGQFYITDYDIEDSDNNRFKFTFFFNNPSIELVLTAVRIKITRAGFSEESDEQFLPTNWIKLLD
ncbi:hypothetical protein HUN28_18910 [Acinetobacter oleivorans]|uniref:hypothetical protein n=1 Tax=Acinetobacter oleivorans TaxID=1148157 RepID=UPI00157FFC44|nr:hypothetical protein [Acinetobacter oleivorans]NUF32254.1 hypothetical protein [Acinetobacter oleivorans]